jgi:hypothetical protein
MAVPHGPVTLVTGTDAYSLTPYRTTTGPDGTVHQRRWLFSSTLTSRDKRVAGAQEGTWNADRWPGRDDDVGMVQWGRSTITNSGGTWVGRYSGVYTPETYDAITWWFTGTGDYKGLSMYLWETPMPTVEDRMMFYALIFPGKPPTP